MHGRSDGVLNVRGVRIGPAEIYRALHGVDEIRESMAVELPQPDGQTAIALLVVLRPGIVTRLPAENAGFAAAIATNASPAHVPALIAQVDELPVTHSGKRSERAARDAVNGRRPVTREALANPQSLESDPGRGRLGRSSASGDLEACAGRSPDSPTEARVIEIWEVMFGISHRARRQLLRARGTSLMAVRLAVHDP